MFIALYKVLFIVNPLQDTLDKGIEEPSPLLEAYHLGSKAEERIANLFYSQGLTENGQFSDENEVIVWIFLLYYFLIICCLVMLLKIDHG